MDVSEAIVRSPQAISQTCIIFVVRLLYYKVVLWSFFTMRCHIRSTLEGGQLSTPYDKIRHNNKKYAPTHYSW